MAPKSVLTRLAIAAALAATLPVHAQISDTTPVIEASGLGFSKAEFEELVRGDSRYQGVVNSAAGRRALANDFGKAFALEAEARRRKLDQTPSMQLKLRHAAQQMLAYELLLTLRKEYATNDAALAAQYEKVKDLYSQPQVRQILVRFKGSEIALRAGQKDLGLDEARAKATALRARIAAGADFAALAKAESDDTGSRARGGDLGFIGRGATSEKVEAAAFSLPVGQLSEVIQSQQGFHVMRVEDRRVMPLAQVKAVVANDLAHKELERITLGNYKLNDAYFQP